MSGLPAAPSSAGQRHAARLHRPATIDTTELTQQPPPLRTGTVRRERLLRRLAQTADVPLTLIVAPAGYGKTTLLAHWLQHDRRPVAWISIAARHDDPACLVADIGVGLRETGSGRAPRSMAELRRSLERRRRPFVLVLDDLQGLSSPASLDVVRAIADAVPHHSQIVLASRGEPALPVGRLRAQGRLVDLRPRDLAMTRREAAEMLGVAGLELCPDDVLALLQRTEGWPAALYLAAVSLRGKPDVHRAVSRFAGDDRVMADYLRDEMLEGLAVEERTFLQRTSVLDRLSGPVCDAVLDSTGSGTRLREMSRSNVLLVPLDGVDATYRYHGLVAQMLQKELQRAEPELEAELHRRASAFYAETGEVDRAIAHAISGGDATRAGELLWTSAGDHVANGRNAQVQRWLQRFPAAELAAHPTLALTAATSHLVVGERDLAEHWSAAAARSLATAPAAGLAAGVTMVRAAVARDGIASMGRDAASAYAGLPEDSPWRSLCSLLSGVHDHLRGAPDAARPRLEDGARRGAIAAPAVQVLCLAQLALIAVDEGDWEEGRLLAARARAQVERVGLGDHPPCALVFAVSALARAHRDRVEEARGDQRRAGELLAMLVDYVPWYDVETRVVLARTALRLGDVTGTRTLLAEASRLLRRAEDGVVLTAWVDALWSRVEAFAVTELVGPSSLTTAELRVLALMPTHQSFREMGRSLHVSPNTVKTHAHAVYRKLDVCSRSEAVVRAREVGLLDAA